jgi:SAM-dependent methyltransferase
MPTETELDEYYTRLYRLDYQGVASSPTSRHLHKRTREAQSRLKHVIDLLRQPSRTLDFGCGTGEFLTSLRSEGHDAHGFEPGQNYGHYAQSLHGDRVKIQTWQHVFYDEPFDLVSCFHVLEHLRDPVAALKKIAEWTRSDGFVYLEVPDMGTPIRNKGFGAMHFAHLIGFNHHNLLIAAALAGLAPVAIVSKTAIIFSHDSNPCQQVIEQEAMAGKQLSLSLYANGRAFKNYLHYQAGKVLRFPGNLMRRFDEQCDPPKSPVGREFKP